LLALFVCSSVMAVQPHPVIEPLPDSEAASTSMWWILASGQIAFYFLAAIGPRGGRLGTLARTFVVLNAAAIVGLWRFARGTQKVTW
jgi:hypothetical protein